MQRFTAPHCPSLLLTAPHCPCSVYRRLNSPRLCLAPLALHLGHVPPTRASTLDPRLVVARETALDVLKDSLGPVIVLALHEEKSRRDIRRRRGEDDHIVVSAVSQRRSPSRRGSRHKVVVVCAPLCAVSPSYRPLLCRRLAYNHRHLVLEALGIVRSLEAVRLNGDEAINKELTRHTDSLRRVAEPPARLGEVADSSWAGDEPQTSGLGVGLVRVGRRARRDDVEELDEAEVGTLRAAAGIAVNTVNVAVADYTLVSGLLADHSPQSNL